MSFPELLKNALSAALMHGELSMTSKARESAVIVGSTTLAVHCAQRLIDSGRSIAAIVPLDDALERWAAAQGLRRVASLDALEELLRGEPTDWLFSIVNPLLLPSSLIERCRLGAINYHDGPLPRYAGTHATFWALLAGEPEHAITWHRMARVADAGDVLLQTAVEITAAETSLSLNLKCFQAAADGFGRLLEHHLSNGTVEPHPQDLGQRTFFSRHRRPHGAGLLQWNRSADDLARLARALDFGDYFFNPLCTVKAVLPDRVIRVERVDLLPNASTRPPGTVVACESNGIRVSTATSDVLVSGLSSLSGRALDWQPRAGDRLPLLTDDELTAITRDHESISGSEPFWRERLQRLRPMTRLSQESASIRRQATGWIHTQDVTDLLSAFMLYVARLLGEEQVQFGFRVRTEWRGCLASTVPATIDIPSSFHDLRRAVESELELLAGHRTFAKDLLARAPELRHIPDLHHRNPWAISVDLVDEREDSDEESDLLTLQVSRRDGSFRLLFDATRISIDDLVAFLQSPSDCDASHGAINRDTGLHGPKIDYPRERSVPQLFSAHARSRPEAPAVIFEDRVMTYGELDRCSSQVATFLCNNGIGRGSLVGVHVHRSVEMVAALLGIMKSGAAYVPMDPAYPRDRIAYMIDDAKLPMLIADSSLRASVPESKARVVSLQDVIRAGTPLSTVPEIGEIDGLAYVIYTSGSTGHPKGVEVGHRALVNLLSSMASSPGFASADRLLAVTTICFDIAGLELYLPLVTGGAVSIVSAADAADGLALRRQLERSRPTVMQATPATWKMLLHAGWKGDLNLKILCGGEALPPDLADELTSHGLEVWNLYGPTETTIWSSMSRVERGRRVTIGRPIANTQFYLLGERLRPAPRGFPAELFIAGDGVAEGYLGRPELTAERFLPCPFGAEGARMYRTGDVVRLLEDGTVEYLNRIDRQTKLHGYRIEPGEIEWALRRHASVKEAVVVVREDTPGDPRLVAYIEAHARVSPPEPELRRHLRTMLPEYEVPAAFVTLPRIPRTPNGKIDCGALPKPSASILPEVSDDFRNFERRIATIWSDVLGRDSVTLDETFFDIGGSSLLMMETVRRLQDAMGRPITSTDMLAYPTVRDMAAFLAGQSEDRHESGGALRPGIGELRRKRLALHGGNAVS